MLDKVYNFLDNEGFQELTNWVKKKLNLKFDKKHMVSITAVDYQALVDDDNVDSDTYYNIIDDYQTFTRYAYYVTFFANAWTSSNGMWVQSVSIAGMDADQTLFLVPYKQDLRTEEESKTYDKNYNLFVSGKGQTTNNGITYKLWSKPTTDITVGLMITDIMNTGGSGSESKGGSGVVVSDVEPDDLSVDVWINTGITGEIDLVTLDEIADYLDNGVCGDLNEEADSILAPVNVVMKSDVLTLEEIEASTSLEGKVASASAVRQLNSELVKYEDITDTTDQYGIIVIDAAGKKFISVTSVFDWYMVTLISNMHDQERYIGIMVHNREGKMVTNTQITVRLWYI